MRFRPRGSRRSKALQRAERRYVHAAVESVFAPSHWLERLSNFVRGTGRSYDDSALTVKRDMVIRLELPAGWEVRDGRQG